MDEQQQDYLREAHERIRRVELTLDTDYGPEEEAAEALAILLGNLETIMSDHFDMAVEA